LGSDIEVERTKGSAPKDLLHDHSERKGSGEQSHLHQDVESLVAKNCSRTNEENGSASIHLCSGR